MIFFSTPMPWPCTMRTRLAVAITARSRNCVHRVAGLFGALADHVDLLMHRRQLRRGPVAHALRQLAAAGAASGSTSSTSSIETCIFMKPASTSMRPSASLRRTRAGSRMSCSRTRTPSSMRRRLDAVLARIVLGGEHGGLEILAQFALDLGYAPLRFLLGFAPVAALRDLADGLLRLLLEARQRLVAAALQFLAAWRSRAFPIRAPVPSRVAPARPASSRRLCSSASVSSMRRCSSRQEARDVALAVAHGLAGAAHDVFRHAQPGGDLEARRFAGQPQLQAKSRLERLLVEAHRAVDHALGGGAVDFERHQVRGDQREGAGRAEVLHDRHAQRAAFFGIGGRAQFVQQHQRIGRHVERHLADVGDVGGKRAEVFLDRLIVADIRQHLLEHRELGLGRGHRQARLRHQAEQPQGLQRHRFAAGIGTADQQRAALAVELQADRHGSLCGACAARLRAADGARRAAAGARRSAEWRNRTRWRSGALAKISSSSAMVTSVWRMESP